MGTIHYANDRKGKKNHIRNRLRVINIYEADYNLILKYFWPHKTTQFAERNNLLGEHQWGGEDLYVMQTT